MKDPVLSVKEKIGYGIMGDGATLPIILALFTLISAERVFLFHFCTKSNIHFSLVTQAADAIPER
ncbi:TPA: hypothetical protein ACK1J8_002443 [Klebsiella quasipneumoniae]|uniref:hypothetical protein n=1 Tax=Klebsiella TaxID=570 RepID=UPI000433DE27|nr:hypothetical protein [Klebsiella quasipneumoniae]MCE0049873.1 hypothetical protein [Klebsiella quasipneumoniae subsp. quasipneumoniae]TYF90009.1 hypothetical protein DJ520_19225 [Klebsiella quasipneumoniae]UDC66074.1 hypothetical protein LGM21_00425 [Klebsiella quasipneumoniae subsp. quasipneumoniae]CDN02942.1 hypothetical protein KPSB59_3690013 [Klebsiella quasipneumoniae subsp. quasipneumoniae]SCA02374.1 Uncharacterised protein [Klebsiella quasipneumoniae]